MHLDVVEIRDFYASRLGEVVRRHIAKRLRQSWPNLKGLAMAGVGYANPYMRAFFNDGAVAGCFYPAGQGGVIWPAEGARRAALIDEGMFPLRDGCFDRILEVHGLEFFADSAGHLEELWRIMRPEGRLLLVVPNRSGLWAQVDTTPFGHGQPFSRGQLQDLLVQCRFRPLRIEPLIHFAPFETPLRLKANMAIERVGAKVWPRFSGMLLVEAIKEVAQPVRPRGLKAPAVSAGPVRVRPMQA